MKFKVYDKAKWHYDARTFPSELPIENGATHIAFFLSWCIENDFISKSFFNEANDLLKIKKIKNGDLDCRQFLINDLDGVFCSEQLSIKGQKFANAYYLSERTKFAKTYGFYCSDVDDWSKKQNDLFTKGNDEAYCYLKNDKKTYTIFKEIINNRYDEFQQMTKK